MGSPLSSTPSRFHEEHRHANFSLRPETTGDNPPRVWAQLCACSTIDGLGTEVYLSRAFQDCIPDPLVVLSASVLKTSSRLQERSCEISRRGDIKARRQSVILMCMHSINMVLLGRDSPQIIHYPKGEARYPQRGQKCLVISTAAGEMFITSFSRFRFGDEI